MVKKVVGKISREMNRETVNLSEPKTESGSRLRGPKTESSSRLRGPKTISAAGKQEIKGSYQIDEDI